MRWVALPVLVLLTVTVIAVPGCTTIQRAALPIAEAFAPAALFRMPVADGPAYVVLTIDDGPSSRTGAILDILDGHDATATFFVHTGLIEGERSHAVLDRASADGHDLAHHMPEDRRYDRTAVTDFEAAFAEADGVLRQFEAGFTPAFRPPRGRYDPAMMDAALARHGYSRPLGRFGSARRYVLASFVPWDAGGATETGDPEKNARIAERYARQLAHGLFPGAIVVFHDGEAGGREERLAATLVSLDLFLRLAAERGYRVVSLSEAVALAEADQPSLSALK